MARSHGLRAVGLGLSASRRRRVAVGLTAPPCVLPPTASYRGAENQLYRVEIHDGGPAGTATFKWSRDNGSRLTPWTGDGGAGELLVTDTRGFDAGAWVELTDDALDLQGLHGTMVQLAKADLRGADL